jgi:imidazolonepropionase
MKKILIKNIKQLIQVETTPKEKVVGKEMATLNTLENAWLAIEGDRIIAFGSMDNWGGITDWSNLEVIDASDKIVMPTFCDSHTHIVFAATRESEFVDRINGLTYEEIAAKGGGILNSAKKLQAASENELFDAALHRINEVISTGTGAIEIKSGYGLTVESEIKMLRVIKRLKAACPITIKATFLGAHALPTTFKENRNGYIDSIINEMLPIIEEENLADYIDVFCEKNYFTPEETERIIQAGIKQGLTPKIHVNQFNSIGGIQVGIKNNALSVDHLEVMTEQDIKDLANSSTMPTLLPSCSFFLNIPYAPARELINNNLSVCLATDYNPGSTPSGNMPFVLSLACIKLRMTPEEAINAATINGAYAMNLSKELGSIAVGKKANIIITKAIPSFHHIPYAFGSNPVETVILNGEKVSF